MPKPVVSGAVRRKTEDGVRDLHKYDALSQHTKGIIIRKKVSIANMLQWTKVCCYGNCICYPSDVCMNTPHYLTLYVTLVHGIYHICKETRCYCLS